MFTIGCDPELFLRDKKTKKLVSAHGLLPGSKKAPYPIPGGAIQVDGMAAEFNVEPVPMQDPYSGPIAFSRGVQDVINGLKEHVGDRYSLVIEPVAHFGAEYIAEQPEEAKELGCDPDFNAYTLEENPRPEGDKGFRTAAGHIHIGWGSDIPVGNIDHIKVCASFVKFLDVTVGFFMTMIEEPNERKELYGKAGAFRPKSYGVEYRTPSNLWLKNQARRKAIFGLVNQAISLRRASELPRYLSEETIQKIINTGDKQQAEKYLFDVYCNWGLSTIIRAAL